MSPSAGSKTCDQDIHDVYLKNRGLKMIVFILLIWQEELFTGRRNTSSNLERHLRFPLDTLFFYIIPFVSVIRSTDKTSSANK